MYRDPSDNNAVFLERTSLAYSLHFVVVQFCIIFHVKLSSYFLTVVILIQNGTDKDYKHIICIKTG